MKMKAVSEIMLTLLLLVLNFNLQRVRAEPTTIMSIYPSTNTVLIGETFAINVTITDVSNLFAWHFLMRFDPDFLQVDNATEGPFLASNGEITDFLLEIDNEEGFVIVGCLLQLPFPEYGVTGDGVLTTIVFDVTSWGPIALEFDKDDVNTYLKEVIWTDYHATTPSGYTVRIPCELVDGHVYAYSSEYNDLNATYHALLTNYSNLQDEFDSLNSSYCELESRYGGVRADLGTTRNLSYLFVATTIVSVATAAYLAIRKPKVKAE